MSQRIGPVEEVLIREQKRVVMYARLAIVTWDRHVKGKPPVSPEQFLELARVIRADCEASGAREPAVVGEVLRSCGVE